MYSHMVGGKIAKPSENKALGRSGNTQVKQA